jgi:hypothetical protein
VVLIDGQASDANAARFHTKRAKAQGLIEVASGLLGDRHREKKLLEPRGGPRGGDGLHHEGASDTLAASGRYHKDAPDVSFMTALGGNFLVKADTADQCLPIESAKDKIFRITSAKAFSVDADRNLQKFAGRFYKRKRIRFEREHAEVVKELGVIFSEPAYFHGRDG